MLKSKRKILKKLLAGIISPHQRLFDLENFENRLMCNLENLALSRGYTRIAGIDEAGRGALAGPVVASCVMLDPQNIPHGIKDSKKLTHKKRDYFFTAIALRI